MDHLTQFLSTNPHIYYATPKSPDFATLQEQFVIQRTKTPRIIVRPRTIDDLASLIKLLAENELPFTIRAGGHDMFGRTQIDNGVTIDLREISHINVDKNTQTARVGGGVINMDLHEELHKHGMTVPHAVTPSVGFTGWAIHGGYGLLSSHYGLGSDQIVGARVVDARGCIHDADEALLTAIRGGGGSVGVIYELVVKIYPSEKILAGNIVFQSEDLVDTIRQYHENYRKLKAEGIPSVMSLYQAVVNGPEGRAFAIFLVWSSSDLTEGQKWVDKMVSLAPSASAVNHVIPTTILEFNKVAASLLPRRVYGSIFCPGVYEMTPEVVNVIGTYAKLQPDYPGIFLGIHELRAEAPRNFENSVFNARDPHFLVEILPLAPSIEMFRDILDWAQRFYDALMKTDPANIYPVRYVPLTPDESLDFKVVYGDRYDILKRAKEQYDPDNVFSHGIVRL